MSVCLNSKIDIVIEKYKNDNGSTIAILQEIQDIYGYLSFDVLNCLSEKLDISLEELYGIVTFYTQFNLVPKGKYQINVCLGTVCYVKGAKDLLEETEKILGIKAGECTTDGKFSIDNTRCLGCCSLAPVITVNDDVYSQVKIKELKDIFDKYQ